MLHVSCCTFDLLLCVKVSNSDNQTLEVWHSERSTKFTPNFTTRLEKRRKIHSALLQGGCSEPSTCEIHVDGWIIFSTSVTQETYPGPDQKTLLTQKSRIISFAKKYVLS